MASQFSSQRLLSYFTSLFLVAFACLFFIDRKFYDKSVYFFIITGFAMLLLHYREFKLSRTEIFLITGLIFYLLIALAMYYAGNESDYGWELLSQIYLKMLILIPVMFLFWRVSIPESVIWLSFLVGAAVAGVIAVNDTWLLSAQEQPYPGRASGYLHPNLYATAALSFTAFSLYGASKLNFKPAVNIVLTVVCVTLGLMATILSGSRGVWLAIPFVTVLVINYYFSHVTTLTKAIIVSVILAVFASLYFIPQTGVANRVDRAVENLRNYNDSELTAAVRASSTGTRLEMWQAAWEAFKENPVFGVGTGDYDVYATQLVEQGERNPSAIRDQPHNQYLSILSMRGVVGFLTFLMVVGCLIYLFYAAMRSRDRDLVRYGYAGMSICFIYLVFGLSDTPFERKSTVFFFAVIVGLLVGRVLQHRTLLTSKWKDDEQTSAEKIALDVVSVVDVGKSQGKVKQGVFDDGYVNAK